MSSDLLVVMERVMGSAERGSKSLSVTWELVLGQLFIVASLYCVRVE